MILRNILFISISVLCFNGYSQLQIKPDNKKIAYMGRVKIEEDSASFYWPGSSATINFTGSSITVSMKSLQEPAFFYAIVDKDVEHAFKFKTDTLKKNIPLAVGLSSGKHSMQLFKLSNNTSENIIFGFQIDGKAKLLKPAKPLKRKIEFYGNSITAGHGVDRMEGSRDTGAPQDFNNYYTYAALTARHYNAQYSCIARSGIGIMVSWFPEIMPEVYDRLNPTDSSSKWNFTKYTPDVVVINLFQNDSWIVNIPTHEQFKARFGQTKPSEEFIINSYQNFVKSIRFQYPKASIICVLGNMDGTKPDSKWPGYIEQAIKGLNDNKIFSTFFPYKNTSGHPNKKEQQLMADQLISFIDKNIKW